MKWYIAVRRKQRLVVIGAEKIPAKGAVLIVANHLHWVDSVVLGLATRRQISFLAKSAYFTDKSLKGRAISLGFRLIGQIPVDRSGGRAAPALSVAISRLSRRRGRRVVCIHGEGTRSPDGKLYEIQTGFTLIAKKSKAVVMPAALIYHDGMIEVHFGDPIAYSGYRHWNTRHFAREMTHRIQQLSGQTLAGRVAEIADKVRHTLKKEESE